MDVLILLIAVCVVLIVGAIGFFAWTVREGTFDHTDRLALLPLDEDSTATPAVSGEEEDGDSTDHLQR